MKFKTDAFGDRELKHTDSEGDILRVSVGHDGVVFVARDEGTETSVYVSLSTKKARKLAYKILKELDR